MRNILPITSSDTEADENALPLGTRVADFEITGVIGEGGFGIVYRAFDQLLQRTVAIKEYMPTMLARRSEDKRVTARLARDQKTFELGLKSFINEARILAQFDHPALVKVYRFWKENNTGYMAMRYYEGQTLQSVIKDNQVQVTQDWLKAMLKPILQALDTLYRVRILHRDISPDNILIQNNGEAVLVDFGAARQILGETSDGKTVMFKPGYAPIEQYAVDVALIQGPWTDIYSLSAVTYLVITKKAPPASVARMIKDPIEWLQNDDHAGFDQEFLAAIDKGLAIQPEDRPQTIEEFGKLLQLDLSDSRPVLPANAPNISSHTPRGSGISLSVVEPKADEAATALTVARGVFARSRMLWIASALCMLGAAAYVLLWPRTTTPLAGHAKERGRSRGRVFAPLTDITIQRAVPIKDSSDVASTSPSPKSTTPVARTGSVKLRIRPWGTVYVDGIYKGESPPLKTLALPEGHHKIEIKNPSFASYTSQVDITNSKSSSVEYDFSTLKKK